MRRMICCAVFALLVSSGDAFSQKNGAGRSRVQVITLQRYYPPYLLRPVAPRPFLYPIPYSAPYSVPYYAPTFLTPAPRPTFVYVGNVSPTRPQLIFKDGTTYSVSDYWRVEDQLHFITVEEGATKSVPHTVPFDTLDVERTKDAATAQGFKFVIRDKPIEQWLEDRGQTPPRSIRTKAKG